ncbi:MAG TPA: RNA polymerase sigma factor [Burkholderiaceae bacterium]|nr:RNA polymerase sigma factor [Burkholderiaceae bacterium]
MPEAPRSDGDLIGQLERGRTQFLALIEPLRPELHRYCARMTGSITDGEDVVQDTLAAAYYELSQLKALPGLRPWLFRVAHNRAIDHWRREQVRQTEPLDAAADVPDDPLREPDQALARQQATRAAISAFLALPPAQRACVVLKDVLDHSLDEIALELDISVPAVKAALHRGRGALATRAPAAGATPAPAVPTQLQRYASLFNARDWDGVRALLADDVRVDLVSRRKLAGPEAATYFTNYHGASGWRMVPAWLDGREVLAVRFGAGDGRPAYPIVLRWLEGRVRLIRDYRYVTYIATEGLFTPAG